MKQNTTDTVIVKDTNCSDNLARFKGEKIEVSDICHTGVNDTQPKQIKAKKIYMTDKLLGELKAQAYERGLRNARKEIAEQIADVLGLTIEEEIK